MSVSPHMHYRGKSFVMETVDGEGDSRVTVEVPEYDFNWQHSYLFEHPIELSQLKQINFTATFDNSEANPFNPDPTAPVTWGDQTYEEMAVAFFEIAEPRNVSFGATVPRRPGSRPKKTALDADFADEFFERFDKDRDGKIIRSEVTKAMKHFGFRQYDLNRDNEITRQELLDRGARRR